MAEFIADIDDDLTRVLALARAALAARDDAAAWCRSPELQIGHHAACCDNLWQELERLVDQANGAVPVIEHPTLKERRIAKRIRAAVVAEVLSCAEDRLDQIIDGGFAWDNPQPIDRSDYEEMHT